MTIIRIDKIREELVNELRNANIFSTTMRNVTTTTQSFTATGGQTNFILTNEPRNIRSLTVNSVNKYLFKDYEVTWTSKTITFYSGLTGGVAVVVNYDYGTTGQGGDKIYPDMPREDLHLNSFPRIGIEYTSQTTDPLGLGALNWINEIVVTIYTWVPADTENNIGGNKYLSYIVSKVREAILNRTKSFQLFHYIQPGHISPIIKGQYDKIIQQSQDFKIRFVVE
jgi:hypothetical protein